MSQYISDLVVLASPDESVLNVISRMSKGGKIFFGLALIVDDSNTLLGVFNSGDALRFLAEGYETHQSIKNVMNTSPVVAEDGLTDQEMVKLVRQQIRARTNGKKEFTQYVPIINKLGNLVDVQDMNELLARLPQQGERVAIYGMGFVGLTLAAALASRGHYVFGIDTNPNLISKLKKGVPHIYEPRLSEMLRQGLDSSCLSFDIDKGRNDCNVFIIAVGTPVDPKGVVSLSALIEVCNTVAQDLRKGDLVMLRSTIPAGTTRSVVIPILEKVSGLKAGKNFYVAFCPERTVEGKAIQELITLPQIVGGLSDACSNRAASFWSSLTDTVVRADGLEAAELIKLANNSFRDISFAFSNALAMLSDEFNIDSNRMIAAANEGYPRDTIPRPSPGVGGYCLTKDPFIYASKDSSLAHSRLARLGREINNQITLYPIEILHRFSRRTGLDITKLNILIIGMAFKGVPATNDLRGSSSVLVAKEMMALGCKVNCYDAVVTSDELGLIGLNLVSMRECLPNVDVIFILNNHPDNITNNFLTLLKPDHPILIFDGWNLLDRFEVEKQANMFYANLGYMTKKIR